MNDKLGWTPPPSKKKRILAMTFSREIMVWAFAYYHSLCMWAAKVWWDCTFEHAGISNYLPALPRRCIHAFWHKHFNLIFLLDFPIHIDTINIGLPIVSIKGWQVECIYDVFQSLKAVLPKYLFNRGFTCWERAYLFSWPLIVKFNCVL